MLVVYVCEWCVEVFLVVFLEMKGEFGVFMK